MATLEQLYGHLKTLNKQWFYDKDEIDELLDEKLDEVEVPSKTSDLTNDGDGDNEFITTSDTTGLIKNDGTIDTNSYLALNEIGVIPVDTVYNGAIQDAAVNFNKLKTDVYDNTAGGTSGASNKLITSGAVYQGLATKVDATDLHAIATSGSFTDLENIPATFAPTAHEHSASDVKDSSAYANLGTSANATQSAINYAVDTKIGSLLSVEYQTIVQTLPTASADTMNKFYLVAESTAETNDNYEIYITVKDGNDYDWEKVDNARLDLVDYASVSHIHGNITNDGKIGSTANNFVYTTTGGLVTSKATIGNITTDGAIGSDSGKVLVTGSNGVITTSDTITEMDSTIQSLIAYGTSLNE